MNIAVIPARGGSKRIPRKNIKIFHGKPMLAWSIELAVKSECFEHVVVSSDDDEVLEVARKYGAIPLRRPIDLSDDLTPTFLVVNQVVRACISLGWKFDNVCCLYPCAPFTAPDDLRSALDLLNTSSSDFVYPVCAYSHPIQRAMKRDLEGRMDFVNPSFEFRRTQDLEVNYFDAGQFYWGRVDAWLQGSTMHRGATGMVFPAWRFVDIDSLEDWCRAEMFFPVLRGL